jgi:hypothetical protein
MDRVGSSVTLFTDSIAMDVKGGRSELMDQRAQRESAGAGGGLRRRV